MSAANAPDLARWRAGILSPDAGTTTGLAAEFAKMLPPDTALALTGDLGSGKTTFVRGLARAFGIREQVTSPTYALFNLYRSGSRLLLHMDAYRLSKPSDADGLALDELLDPPWTLVVEWPEKLGDRLPRDAWRLDFGIESPGAHRIRLISPES